MEFASCYTLQGEKREGFEKPYVIRYIKYNKHIDPNNYCRERMMLYVPYRIDGNSFQEQNSTWKNAYLLFKEIIKCNEQNFTNKTITSWTNIDSIAVEI